MDKNHTDLTDLIPSVHLVFSKKKNLKSNIKLSVLIYNSKNRKIEFNQFIFQIQKSKN